MKIERRRRDVSLHQGNYEAELAALLDETMAAQRAEAAEETEAQGAPMRVGQAAPAKKSKKSIELARRYDVLMTEAEEAAVKVTVWAISHDEWSHLADQHPPRDDVPEDKENALAAKTFEDDKQRGVNTRTFPPLLLKASLVEPRTKSPDVGIADHVAELILEGGKILAALDLSRLHYVKLETAAWNVNVGDDALPKWSLVSLLNQESNSESASLNDSE